MVCITVLHGFPVNSIIYNSFIVGNNYIDCYTATCMICIYPFLIPCQLNSVLEPAIFKSWQISLVVEMVIDVSLFKNR